MTQTPSEMIAHSLSEVRTALEARLAASGLTSGVTAMAIWDVGSAYTTCKLVTKPSYAALDILNGAAKLLDNWGREQPDAEFIKRSPSLGAGEILAMSLSPATTAEEVRIIEAARGAIAARKAELDAERKRDNSLGRPR